ncbi:MAG: hypothetical protein ACRC8Y_07205 [Chroococcales cyanobacterium]
MNIFSLKLRIDSLQIGHTSDGNIQVMGFSSFQFFDGKQTQVSPLAFTAYGLPAQTIAETGINGVVVAIGEINIFSVERQNRKDKVANFYIEEAQTLRPGNPVEVPLGPNQTTTQSPNQPTTQPPVTPSPIASPEKREPVGVVTASSNGHCPVDIDEEIPF